MILRGQACRPCAVADKEMIESLRALICACSRHRIISISRVFTTWATKANVEVDEI
jgi:hypothetical protein